MLPTERGEFIFWSWIEYVRMHRMRKDMAVGPTFVPRSLRACRTSPALRRTTFQTATHYTTIIGIRRSGVTYTYGTTYKCMYTLINSGEFL